MTSVVFGAAGSLGGSFVVALQNHGDEVLAVARGAAPANLSGSTKWLRVDKYEDCDLTGVGWSRAFLTFGVFLQKPLLGSSELEIAESINANLTSQILLVRRLLAGVDRSDGARRDIVLIGSTSSYTGFAGSSVYCASKFGLRGFVEAMNAEWSDSNVRFWLVSMGSMNNEMGRRVPNVAAEHLLSPDEIAADVVRVVTRGTSSFQPEIIIRRRWLK